LFSVLNHELLLINSIRLFHLSFSEKENGDAAGEGDAAAGAAICRQLAHFQMTRIYDNLYQLHLPSTHLHQRRVRLI
jgi:hypothetical protein